MRHQLSVVDYDIQNQLTIQVSNWYSYFDQFSAAQMIGHVIIDDNVHRVTCTKPDRCYHSYQYGDWANGEVRSLT